MTTLPPEANNEQNAGAGQTPPQGPPVPPQGQVPPQNQMPPQGPPTGQPQYQAPPPGAYQAPPPGAYQQPPPGYAQQPGYQQPAPAHPADSLTLNYWLSVFFTWIPALIFWVIEKDKGDQRARSFHAANLNFSLVRIGVAIILAILYGILMAVLPWTLWWFAGLIIWLGNLTMLVLHAVAAASVTERYRAGGQPNFVFNIDMVK